MRWRLALGCTLGLLACGDEVEDAALRGSLSQVYSLEFTGVRARLDARELAIQYVDGDAVPVQVVVRITEQPLAGPATIDLTRYGTVVGQRGPTRVPPFVSGQLRLDRYAPEDGAAVSGDFQAVVRTERGDLTVVGEFSTALEDIR